MRDDSDKSVKVLRSQRDRRERLLRKTKLTTIKKKHCFPQQVEIVNIPSNA